MQITLSPNFKSEAKAAANWLLRDHWSWLLVAAGAAISWGADAWSMESKRNVIIYLASILAILAAFVFRAMWGCRGVECGGRPGRFDPIFWVCEDGWSRGILVLLGVSILLAWGHCCTAWIPAVGLGLTLIARGAYWMRGLSILLALLMVTNQTHAQFIDDGYFGRAKTSAMTQVVSDGRTLAQPELQFAILGCPAVVIGVTAITILIFFAPSCRKMINSTNRIDRLKQADDMGTLRTCGATCLASDDEPAVMINIHGEPFEDGVKLSVHIPTTIPQPVELPDFGQHFYQHGEPVEPEQSRIFFGISEEHPSVRAIHIMPEETSFHLEVSSDLETWVPVAQVFMPRKEFDIEAPVEGMTFCRLR